MITREHLMEVCGRDIDAPEAPATDITSGPEICGEISLEGSRYCVLDGNHSGPHAFEKLIPKVPIKTDGMVLHCARCNTELTRKSSATSTGFWCDSCCYPPSMQDTYLARPKPKMFKMDHDRL